MIIREFAKPVTAKSLNESLAAKFGQRIALEKFTLEELQDVRNKLRTKLRQVETMESFDAVQNEVYQKSKLMMDVLNAAIAERGAIEDSINESESLYEGEEDKAELVMAAKDMVDRITGWMEDTAEMQTESMLELADAIRDELGQEASEAFTSTIKPALDSLYSAMEATRTTLTQGLGQLTGEAEPAEPMGAEEPTDDIADPADDLDAELAGGETDPLDVEGELDDFGADAAATGGDEPADRAKRESIDPRRLGKILSSKKK